ncbi:MAG: hypothetical protein D6770_02830 [Anaerolineae bacterium]|nr:MAG: hypothetical protein D6770_02830 [Anaerolineae bacterium]
MYGRRVYPLSAIAAGIVCFVLLGVMACNIPFFGALAPQQEGAPSEVQIFFVAERTRLSRGECTTLRWEVSGTYYEVWLSGPEMQEPVAAIGQGDVCPEETTVYSLNVDTGETVESRPLEIRVVDAPLITQPSPPAGVPRSPSPGPPSPLPQPTSTPQLPPSPPTSTPPVTLPPVVIMPTPTLFIPMLTVDLALTDLYVDGGKVYVLIANYGAEKVEDLRIQYTCWWTENSYFVGGGSFSDQKGPTPVTIIALNPGQTTPFDTYITVDLANYWYDVTCSIVEFPTLVFDTDPSNDTYQETLMSP